MHLQSLDYTILALYIVTIIAVALWVSREKPGHKKNTTDYFLAGKSLPWWAIGASLIAANISAEQIIGMSGSGFALGLAIASYEWMSAITLILVGKYALPIFLKHQIYTMPQFLESRFGASVKYVMSVFWLILYTVVNLTTILWLGATAIHSLTGLNMMTGMIALAAMAVTYSLYGGLKAVAFTDIIQVVLLVAGGILISCIALAYISPSANPIEGFAILMSQAPDKFDMILSKDNPEYINLPGIGVLIGGMWIMNISYWGFNQYIIQRALGAKNKQEAQKGIVMAAFLKIIMPFIIVVPGIAATMIVPDIPKPDHAYPEMLKLAPAGLRGLIFAALIAAIVSSVGSMMNSISTIFTLDLVKPLIARNTSEDNLVTIGRIASFTAIVIALFLATPLLGNSPQVFQNIQNWTGFFTPGVVAIFTLGFLWKRATEFGGLAALISSVALSVVWPLFFPYMPFMDRVGIVFLLSLGIGVACSFLQPQTELARTVNLKEIDFTTSNTFNVSAILIVLILTALYAYWW